MAQYVYLIRHGRPELPSEASYCIGSGTDVPLAPIGKAQGAAWKNCFDFLPRMYCSPLRRSKETVEAFARKDIPVLEDADLQEVDVGAWEGLTFQAIRQTYPERYAQRGIDWSIPPVGGESLEHAADRLQRSILRFLSATTGDVLAVTHEGCIRALMQRLLWLDTKREAMFKQPYGSLTVLRYEQGQLMVTAIGKLPDDIPTDDEIENIWNIYGTPAEVRNHCYAVRDECLRICSSLRKNGISLSTGLIGAAAMLHDVFRPAGRVHPQMAASMLRERGYIKIAALVELHHDAAAAGEIIDGTAILYLADKLIRGDCRVSLEERFSASRSKCLDAEARQKHRQRFEAAIRIENKIKEMLH